MSTIDKLHLIEDEIRRRIEKYGPDFKQPYDGNYQLLTLLDFINSLRKESFRLWHNASETPKKGELFLYETNQNIIDILRSNGKGLPDWCTRWAYIEDIFNIQDSQLISVDSIECTVEQCEVEGIKLDSVEICPDGITLDENKFAPGEKVKVIIIKEK